MNFTVGQPAEVSFAVDVMGTSAQPSTRLIIETHPELSFPCSRVGDRWSTTVQLPDVVEAGTYKMRVEVLLNNRLFTPFSKPVEVARFETMPANLELVPTVDNPPEVQPEEPVEVEVVPEAKAETIVEAVVEKAPEPIIPKIKTKLIREMSQPPVEEKPKKIDLPRDFFKFTPKKIEKTDVVVPSLDEAMKLTKNLSKATGKKPEKVVEVKSSGTPVTLTKGEIIYE